ncbi:hypothetical protein GSI_10692 [Ganoderma sinense ZZ0214-1]|uniref:Hydrophobin n=1 Tax=Ganoderma sinense ZZ0214-1 TaxID=1077348 RepID=A0A2G8S1A4_9APHY|nr:hypothetical protein GSI_10692 [Ganoderma sinense ZZ0214-1]
MLARSIVAVSAVLSLPILATAASLAGIADQLGSTDASSGTCTTGTLNCCQAVGKPTDSSVDTLLGPLLGVILHGVTAVVGVSCTPITAVGVGLSNTCQAQPACCPNNASGNLVSVGCVPVSL